MPNGFITRINKMRMLNMEQVDVWMVKQDIDIDTLKLQEDKVVDVKLITFEEFDKMIENKKVVLSIKPSYSLIKNLVTVFILKYSKFKESIIY